MIHEEIVDITTEVEVLLRSRPEVMRHIARSCGALFVLSEPGTGPAIKVAGADRRILASALSHLRTLLDDHTNFVAEREINKIHVFVDISNITIGAQDLATMRSKGSVRINVSNLLEVVTGLRTVARKVAVGSQGSQSSASSAVGQAWQNAGFEVTILQRVSVSGNKTAEQSVDDLIHAALQQDLLRTYPPPARTVVLLTGDGNCNSGRTSFPSVVEGALLKDWNVELWCWKNSMAGIYGDLQDAYAPLFVVRHLDDFLDFIVVKDANNKVPPQNKQPQTTSQTLHGNVEQPSRIIARSSAPPVGQALPMHAVPVLPQLVQSMPLIPTLPLVVTQLHPPPAHQHHHQLAYQERDLQLHQQTLFPYPPPPQLQLQLPPPMDHQRHNGPLLLPPPLDYPYPMAVTGTLNAESYPPLHPYPDMTSFKGKANHDNTNAAIRIAAKQRKAALAAAMRESVAGRNVGDGGKDNSATMPLSAPKGACQASSHEQLQGYSHAKQGAVPATGPPGRSHAARNERKRLRLLREAEEMARAAAADPPARGSTSVADAGEVAIMRSDNENGRDYICIGDDENNSYMDHQSQMLSHTNRPGASAVSFFYAQREMKRQRLRQEAGAAAATAAVAATESAVSSSGAASIGREGAVYDKISEGKDESISSSEHHNSYAEHRSQQPQMLSHTNRPGASAVSFFYAQREMKRQRLRQEAGAAVAAAESAVSSSGAASIGRSGDQTLIRDDESIVSSEQSSQQRQRYSHAKQGLVVVPPAGPTGSSHAARRERKRLRLLREAEEQATASGGSVANGSVIRSSGSSSAGFLGVVYSHSQSSKSESGPRRADADHQTEAAAHHHHSSRKDEYGHSDIIHADKNSAVSTKAVFDLTSEDQDQPHHQPQTSMRNISGEDASIRRGAASLTKMLQGDAYAGIQPSVLSAAEGAERGERRTAEATETEIGERTDAHTEKGTGASGGGEVDVMFFIDRTGERSGKNNDDSQQPTRSSLPPAATDRSNRGGATSSLNNEKEKRDRNKRDDSESIPQSIFDVVLDDPPMATTTAVPNKPEPSEESRRRGGTGAMDSSGHHRHANIRDADSSRIRDVDSYSGPPDATLPARKAAVAAPITQEVYDITSPLGAAAGPSTSNAGRRHKRGAAGKSEEVFDITTPEAVVPVHSSAQMIIPQTNSAFPASSSSSSDVRVVIKPVKATHDIVVIDDD